MRQFAQPKYNPIASFEGWTYSMNSPSDFQKVLSMFNRMGNNVLLREQVIYHKGDLNGVAKKILQTPFVQFQAINETNWLFSASSVIRSKDEIVDGLLLIVPGKHSNMYRFITVSKATFWNHVVRKFVKKSYPELMRVFFKQDEIQNSFEVLQAILGGDHRIHVLDATLKSRRESDIKNGIKRQFNTDRVWRDQPINEMFNEALENSQWFSSLKFAIQKKNRKTGKFSRVAMGKISKFGEISCDNYFEQIEEGFTSVLEGFASERLELYQSRGIRERQFKPSPPLEIEYSTNVFDDVEEIRRFGRMMKGYPDSSIALFHGNPYYHASIADFSDGSSFDLWVLSPKRVLISPQAKSSPQALERITSYIFYEFREGVVKEYVETE